MTNRGSFALGFNNFLIVFPTSDETRDRTCEEMLIAMG